MIQDDAAEKFVAGPEYDGPHFERLRTTLRTLGYRTVDSSWGVGGSQELRTWEVRGPAGSLRVEAETYIGLTVSGPSALIAALRRAFEQSPS